MIKYNLTGSKISFSNEQGYNKAMNVLNDQRQIWFGKENDKVNNCKGQFHITFKKPIIMNGFGLVSAFDGRYNPKDFRLYAKVIRHKGELNSLNESEFGPYAGFDLVKDIKNERMGYQSTKKYLFDNNAKHLVVSEIKFVVDKLHDERVKEGP